MPAVQPAPLTDAAGTYCDVVHSATSSGSCSGATMTVNAHGRATVSVAAKDAVAIDGLSRLRS